MKIRILLFTVLIFNFGLSQDTKNESNDYKKRVLESIEIDFLSSYYTQEGSNASVTGGIGNEELEDFNPNLPSEPSVPMLEATPIGNSMKKSSD